MANVNPIIQSTPVNTDVTRIRPAETVDQTKTREARVQGQDTEKPQETADRLENVIAVSKDGDTVQASDKAVQELDEEEKVGRVIDDPSNRDVRREQEKNGAESREELQELELERSAEIRKAQLEAVQEESKARREEAMEAARESVEQDDTQNGEPNAVLADEERTIAEQGQISSFKGFSDAELERMYLQGNISKFDYDKEMESREVKEEARKEQLADFSLDTADRTLEAERTQMRGEEIERAFSDAANERLDAANRMQVLQVMERTVQAEDADPNTIAPLSNFALG